MFLWRSVRGRGRRCGAPMRRRCAQCFHWVPALAPFCGVSPLLSGINILSSMQTVAVPCCRVWNDERDLHSPFSRDPPQGRHPGAPRKRGRGPGPSENIARKRIRIGAPRRRPLQTRRIKAWRAAQQLKSVTVSGAEPKANLFPREKITLAYAGRFVRLPGCR
jgi:hypothetical protein